MTAIMQDGRLSYYTITPEMRAALRDFSPYIGKTLPQILDRFYVFVTSQSLTKKTFQNPNVDHLKSLQKEHWQGLFRGEFGEDYYARCQKIGEINEALGVTPILYIGGCNFVLGEFTAQVLKKHGSRSKKSQLLLRAVQSVVLMDMELALTSFNSATQIAQSRTSNNEFVDQILNRNVDLSMSVNEVAIDNTVMMNSLENVSSRSQSIAAAVEEMAVGIATISGNSHEVASSAEQAQQESSTGKTIIQDTAANMNEVAQAVRQASEQMQSLVQTSGDITKMLQSIEDIAAQTNLLALNATIEAARAGEAGKGFAVVANEVKSLSTQTANATEQIRKTISGLTEEIDKTATLMNDGAMAVTKGEASMQDAVSSIDSISTAISLTSERMGEIAGILEEQESISAEASSNVASIAGSAGENVTAITHSIDAMDQVVALIGSQIQALSDYEVPKKSIRIAKADHIVWKKRLADMVAGRQSLKADELASHHSCRLGKWYYSDDVRNLKNTQAYRDLEAPHRVVHECGIRAVEKYNAGEREEAVNLLRQVDEASKEVIRLLDLLIAS